MTLSARVAAAFSALPLMRSSGKEERTSFKKNKSNGYKLVDGDLVAGIKIPLEGHTGKTKVPTNQTTPR